jgi:hypothetical protein
MGQIQDGNQRGNSCRFQVNCPFTLSEYPFPFRAGNWKVDESGGRHFLSKTKRRTYGVQPEALPMNKFQRGFSSREETLI